MRKIRNAAILFAAALAAGWLTACYAQVPPNPTITAYTCPASTGTAYVTLNASSPATGLAYTDTKPAAGTYCYIAQTDAAGVLVSLPSNIAGPYTTSGSNSVGLTWTAPASGATPTGYELSRAAATATVVTVGAPVLGNATVAALQQSGTVQVADKTAPGTLRGSVRD